MYLILLTSILYFGNTTNNILNPFVMNSMYRGTPIQINTGDQSPLDVNLQLLEKQTDCWFFELQVVNRSNSPFYIMSHPIQTKGNEGPYISLSTSSPDILHICIKLYPPPDKYQFNKNSAGVKLSRIEPNSLFKYKFVIRLPVRRTVPPYDIDLSMPIEIDTLRIKSIKVEVGFLPALEPLQEMLKNKEAYGLGSYVNGYERIEVKGVMILLRDLQEVVLGNDLRL